MNGTSTAVAVKIETAAQLLDASESQVRYWIKMGMLPAQKLGRSWRIPRAAIEAIAGGRAHEDQ